MASEWHYAKDGVKLGPVPSQRLKELAASGELSPSDLVWKDGLPEWRPASTLKGLFPEDQPKPAGPPQLPTAKSDAQPQPPLEAVELDAPTAAVSPAAEPTDPTPQRKPDIFEKARNLAQKAKAKAEAFQKEATAKVESFQKEAREKAERTREESKADQTTKQTGVLGGAKAAANYAQSDEAKELVRKTQEKIKGGAKAAADYARSDEGREQIRRAAENPFVVASLLVLFFPLGLFLVWRHPLWTPRAKWTWAGTWLGLVCLGLAMKPFDAGGDQELIQGEWNLVQDDGSEVPWGVFKGDTLICTIIEATEKFTLDPSQNPKHITFEGSGPGGHYTTKGIYKFKNGELYICSNGFERTRFSPGVSGNATLRELFEKAARHSIANARPTAFEKVPIHAWTVRMKRAGGGVADKRSQPSGTGDMHSTAAARRELMETAQKFEGEATRVVQDIVDGVERGGQSWSIADSRINERGSGKIQFTDETIAAYERWRAARIADSRK